MRSPLAVLFFVLGSLVSRPAAAHDPYETTTKIFVGPEKVEVEMIMARATAEAFFGEAQVAQPGQTWKPWVTFDDLYAFSDGRRSLKLLARRAAEGVKGEAKDDLVFHFEYAISSAKRVQVRAHYMEKLEQGYTGVVQVVDAQSSDLIDIKVLHSSDPVMAFSVPVHLVARDSGTLPDEAPPQAAASQVPQPFWLFLWIGVEHVLYGYDHLLFLLGVLLACFGWRQALGLLTTFTLAHSVTLGLAAFHLVPLVNGIVEPLIALSIAVAAFWGRPLEARGQLLPMTFAFGLIHGLGFAAGLQDLVDTGNVRVLGLVGFNLGVELGQIGAALVLLPAVEWCRRSLTGKTALDWTARAIGVVGASVFVWRVSGL